MVRNYGDKNTTSPDPFPVYYQQTVANLAETQWNFGSYQPDIVVILLGDNDYSTDPSPSFDQFHAGYRQTLQMLYSNYPRVQHVFCACGPYGRSPCSFVQQIVQIESQSEPRTKFATLAGTLTDPTDYGCNGHPSLQGDQKMATKLVQQMLSAIRSSSHGSARSV